MKRIEKSGEKMGERKHIKTTMREIAKYWETRVDECEWSIDWREAESHCWRCGYKKRLQRCHIIPAALGGKDEPENMVILCVRCHAENPNVEDPEIMWDWIKAYNTSCYGTFWDIQALKEYEFIYKSTVEYDIEKIFTEAGVENDEKEQAVMEALLSTRSKISVHFGQPYYNTATIAGIYRMMLKELAKKYGVTLKRI